MDPIYPRFAASHPDFYDERPRGPRTEGGFAPDAELDWSSWRHSDDGHWSFWNAPDKTLPDQGWKIHVSTTVAGATDILRWVSRYCFHSDLVFKHLSHPDVLRAVDSKESDRSGSGKFITVYPTTDTELHDVLVDLDGLVGGAPGPYVLSDLRWNAGPVSVRYGAFRREFTLIDGVQVAALRAPDGKLVEDVRSAAFVVPDWVTLPPFLAAQVASLGQIEPPRDFPSVTHALHHSNAGGVYEAVDLDGADVVLKEARPHAGLTPDGRDAFERLRNEARVLARIDNDSVVRMRRVFDAYEHRFLVMDRVEGQALNKAVVSRHPLIRSSSTAEERSAYRDWALTITQAIAEALAHVHAAGFSHGDLHPGNVLVRDDDRVVLLDFEMSRPLSEEVPAIIGAPGFVPRDQRGGRSLDAYALACIRLFVFAPLTPLIGLDPSKAQDLVEWVQQRFDLDGAWGRSILTDLDLDLPAVSTRARASDLLESWRREPIGILDELVTSVGETLIADLDATRLDRAWPGDPAQFGESPVSIAHGASGVLLALDAARIDAPRVATDWYEAAVERELLSVSPRLGLYDGLAGVAWAQRRLGMHVAADRTIDRLRVSALRGLGNDLYSGATGIGLLLLDESRRDESLLPLAVDLADDVRRSFLARQPREGSSVTTDRGGVLRGASGIALFATRMYLATEDEQYLELAEGAIDDDLSVCTWAPDGSLQIDEGWRLMPYLATGSAGIGMVLTELAPLSRHRDRYEVALDGIRAAASAEFIVNPGLFQGRAGLIHLLIALGRSGYGTGQSDRALADHIRALQQHALRTPEGLGFPGHALIRRSCDLATGSAGVLSAIAAYRDLLFGKRVLPQVMPFLDLPPDAQPAASVARDLARA